jgi:hypothetical protein
MGNGKKAVERRVEPLVLHDSPHSLTDEIGVGGHIEAWEKNKNAAKAKEARTVDPRDYTGCVYARNCRDCTGHGCDCEQRVAPHKPTRGPANNLYVYG